MKLLDIADLPEVMRENVHIGDKEQLLQKVNKLIAGGHQSLQIVTDFDHTLTRHKMDNGKIVLTSFGMFRECPSIPQHYKDEDTRLSGIYKPIEADPHMTVEEKTKHMIDWYHAAHALLKGVKLPRNELAESGNKMKDSFRIGVRTMITWSSERGVPVLVFSAGLGEAVVAALTASGLLLPNVKFSDMKLLDIADLPEVMRENVHIGDKEQLLQKVNKLIAGGHQSLQIVTDFDHTLTRHKMDNGKIVLTSFGMFRECPSIPQHYKDEDTRLSGIYKPIEADPHMTVEEKTKHMIDWYHAAHALLKGVKLPRNELAESGNKMKDSFRIGVRTMITWSSERGVPVLVFSAGLGEAVVAALTASGLLLPNVKVVSNFLALDENDCIVGIKGEVIHTYNKNETAIKHTDYYGLVKDRSNVILMGDNIGDAGMAEGMEHCDTVLKVGFLGHGEQNLPNYLKNFDIVLVDEHSVDLVNAILKLVL